MAEDLRSLVKSALKAMPEVCLPTEDLVPKSEVLDELEEIRLRQAAIEKLTSRMKGVSRTQDVFTEFSVDAAKQLVLEMQTAKTSHDRRQAAEKIISWDIGKPVERAISMSAQVGSLSDHEVDSKINDLIERLGFVKTDLSKRKRLIQEDKAVAEATPVEAEVVDVRTTPEILA